MPHVLTTTHDLLVSHIFTIHPIAIVPPPLLNTVAIVVYSSVALGRWALIASPIVYILFYSLASSREIQKGFRGWHWLLITIKLLMREDPIVKSLYLPLPLPPTTIRLSLHWLCPWAWQLCAVPTPSPNTAAAPHRQHHQPFAFGKPSWQTHAGM